MIQNVEQTQYKSAHHVDRQRYQKKEEESVVPSTNTIVYLQYHGTNKQKKWNGKLNPINQIRHTDKKIQWKIKSMIKYIYINRI